MAKLRLINGSNRRVEIQQGPVGPFFGRWIGDTPRKFNLQPGEATEKDISCDSRLCVYAERHLLPNEDEPNIVEYFLQTHGTYIVQIAAYGVILVATNAFSDYIKEIVDVENFSWKATEEEMMGIIKKLIEKTENEEVKKLLLCAADKVIPELSQKIKDFSGVDIFDVILQRAFVKLALNAAQSWASTAPEDRKGEWVHTFSKEFESFATNLCQSRFLYLSPIVWKAIQRYAPEYIKFLKKCPPIVVKKVAIAGLAYKAYYHHQRSPYASSYFTTLHADAYEEGDHELVEIVVMNFGHQTIQLQKL